MNVLLLTLLLVIFTAFIVPFEVQKPTIILVTQPIIEKEVEKELVETKPDGVNIDLDKMEMEIWQDGELFKKYPLLAIRKGFRNFNTPTGEFKALTKEINHLSSYFDVWMPYSVQFYGDYFLHGYPTYNDDARTLVPYGTSGGCIRMNTEDMKEIFEFIKVGTPINIK